MSMTPNPGFDPIRKSSREANAFNTVWMKNGEKVTRMQRVGFAVFSLFFLFGGSFFGALAVGDIWDGELLGAVGWSVPTLMFLVPGFLGLRNVLRFRAVDSD